MLILGSGGFAMQILDVLSENPTLDLNYLSFFNNTGKICSEYIHSHFNIVSDYESFCLAKDSVPYILGTGTPIYRKNLFQLFNQIENTKAIQVISNHAIISSINVRLFPAVSIMAGTVIMGNVEIGTGALINCNSSIGHDSILGEFVEICPGVVIDGNCIIGSLTFIGSGAVIFPGISIGENCIIGAGTIVTKDVPANHKVIGNPGLATKL